jgi:uncharacterized protein (TIGR02147 family)
MNIFNDLSYRNIIKNLVEEKKRLNSSINFQKMAEFMGIQKAYLSQVIKDKRDFNQDQLYSAVKYLKLNEEEYEYMSLLLEYERSGLAKRKDELLKDIKTIQKKHAKTSKHLKVTEVELKDSGREEYYLDPINQLVHVALTIKTYLDEPNKLADHLMVPKKRIENSLSTLQRLGVIEVNKGKIKVITQSIHLSRDSIVYHAWKVALNNLCVNKLRNLNDDNSYSMSASFSSGTKAQEEIHQLFLEFLNKAKQASDKYKPTTMYQINFDLFKWT